MPGARPIGALAGKFDDRLDVLPPLTDEQLAEVPAKRGVFLLADERDRCEDRGGSVRPRGPGCRR